MKIVYENPWFHVLKQNQYHFIRETGSDNGAVIIAMLKNTFIFVKVFRQAHQNYILELPRGYGVINESSTMTAIRELQEETGYTVALEHLKFVGKIKPNSSILCSNIPVYFAKIYERAKQDINLMDSETNEVLLLDQKEVFERIANGEISDGISLSDRMLYFTKFECEKLDK